MNRAEKRRRQKLAQKAAGGASSQHTQVIRQTLSVAMQHHTGGNLGEAKRLYEQILQADPNQPDALHLLGAIAQQVGKNDVAVDLITKALALMPANAEAHYNLGNAYQAMGKLEEAVTGYQRAVDLKPQFAAAHYNLGSVLDALGKFDAAVTCFHRVLALSPDHADAHNNLGNALKSQGNLDGAVASYRHAVALQPAYAQVQCNLARARVLQGALDAAVQGLQAALEKTPGQKMVEDCLIDILSHHLPRAEMCGPHAQAQQRLQQVKLPTSASPTLTNESIRNLYRQAQDILTAQGLSGKNVFYQFWRGLLFDRNCVRHMKVFETFNIIPKECFGCFKVSVKPRTVMELFKLMVVFDGLALPQDNSRKCLVEVRPEIAGTYTGLIYCHSLEEANEIKALVEMKVGAEISDEIAVAVKRGCSEYPLAYPQYLDVASTGEPTMAYDEAWREREVLADDTFIGHVYPPAFRSHNHTGLTLQDAVVMQSWLAYAAAIGDLSYQGICAEPPKDLPIPKRPPFQTGETGA